MSYVINLTDGTIFAVVADGTLNTESSMTLIGQNYEEYGDFINENFIHLLENSSNSTPPGDPLTGQLWWDKTNNLLKVYNGTTFKVISASTASSVAPTSNVQGDLWYDTVQEQLKVYTGIEWLVVGPAYSTDTGVTGAIVDTITDNLSGSHIVVKLMVDNAVVGIISKDAEFTPATTISGFATVKPGLQLAVSVNGQTPLFQGTSTNSQLFNSLTINDFLRKNVNQSTTGSLTIVNNDGLTVGSNGALKASVSGNSVVLENQINNGNILINSIVGGTPTTVMNINGSTGRATVIGVPVGSNDNTVATTAFVNSTVDNAKISPAFTGVPTAPSATFGTSNTQIATTAFVQSAVTAATGSLGTMSTQNANAVAVTGGSVIGVTASLIGAPTAPTATIGVSNTQIATTAFVNNTVADYAPAKDGTGASGLWGINIAGSASTAATAGYITNSSYNGYGIRTVSTSPPTGGNDGDIWYKI